MKTKSLPVRETKKITYAESQGKKPFDWNRFLDRAARREKGIDWKEAAALAENWVTCACGNQCALIPRKRIHTVFGNRYVKGVPKDSELSRLGVDFSCYIAKKSYAKARRVLAAIERRSAEILSEMAAQS